MSQSKIPVDLILSKLAEDTEKAQTRAQKASDVLLGELQTELAQTPYEVVFQEDRVKLKHYLPRTEIKYNTPLLVTYALINRETMLDLQPGRSVVERFLNAGIDLYMIDWGYPTRKDRYMGFEDHIDGYMNSVVDYIRSTHKLEKINLMGICMGGTFSVIYSALYPEKIKNLITTVTPTNFNTDKGLLHVWMKSIDADRVVNTFGNLPADIMNLGFLLLNPARLMIDKYVGFMENMDNKTFVENFVRMEKWIFDSPDLPGEVFREFIKDCYQGNKLLQNEMVVGERQVNLNKLTMPVLNIYGKYDHLVPPEACDQLVTKVGSKDTEDICLNTGHIGIYVSSKYQEEFAPKIATWLKERDQIDPPSTRAKRGKATASKAAAPAKPKAAAAQPATGRMTTSSAAKTRAKKTTARSKTTSTAAKSGAKKTSARSKAASTTAKSGAKKTSARRTPAKTEK